MKRSSRISDAEWTVMDLVWKRSPLAASDIVEELASRKGWHPSTIRTLVTRLVKKGALSAEPDGKRYLYRPRIQMEECTRRESRRFLERVFGGEPGTMLVNLVKQTELSREEIRQLKQILEEKEG
ncbi:MAG: BlaI/MecI/CopY family transcriptional regulator [Verrucomicrobia bacterium]|nr:BlaI/MecI/CopY family transcriptional regulator [Verrucomicrobiota bacterium]